MSVPEAGDAQRASHEASDPSNGETKLPPPERKELMHEPSMTSLEDSIETPPFPDADKTYADALKAPNAGESNPRESANGSSKTYLNGGAALENTKEFAVQVPPVPFGRSYAAAVKNVSDGDSHGNGEKSQAANGTATSSTEAVVAKTEIQTLKSSLEDPSSYPPLPGGHGQQGHEKEATTLGGIRFAPLRVPFLRRMQTAAVLFHCMSIVSFVAVFFFIAAIPLSWPIIVPYLISLSLSTAATNGRLSKRSEWLRSLPLWRLFAGYYPATLHKTHDLPPTRKYIFGYHPHGIISHGAWAAFATNALGFNEKFPGIQNTILTLDSNFRIPLYRDWILAMGIGSVSKESIWNILTKGGRNNEGMGRAVTIVVGGARESLEAEPGTLRLILKGRKGFVKMALRTGADLVPVLGFGENDLYDQLSPKTHPMVHKLQMLILHVFKFTLPAMHGRGLLNYDVGLMPYRRPLNIVVGKPIKVSVAGSAPPDQAEVDRLHALYVAELQKMWDAYKDQFASDRKTELQFIA